MFLVVSHRTFPVIKFKILDFKIMRHKAAFVLLTKIYWLYFMYLVYKVFKSMP